jgi:hypothetical protein
MRKKSVLVIGLAPEQVDFTAFPGLTAEKVRAGIASQIDALKGQGFDARHVFVDLGETAESVVKGMLDAERFDCVCIGAGLRLPPPHFRLFERLINVVHGKAPQATICFNTGPMDTVDAVRRWTRD